MKNILAILILTLGTFSAQSQRSFGLIPPTAEEYKSNISLQNTYIGQGQNIYLRTLAAYGDANASSFDLRDINAVSAVKSQGNCGSCWAFTTAASLESSNALINGELLDVSEQQMVNCAPSSGCNGGFYDDVFSWMMSSDLAITNEASIPYQEYEGQCTGPVRQGVKVANWSSLGYFASEQQVKEAIVTHGAVSAALYANSSDFLDYTGGFVLRGYENYEITHAVSVIGWDDAKQAWLIKNSWGEYWGEDGFGWVGYDSYGIGYFSWVDVLRNDASPDSEDEEEYANNNDEQETYVIDFVDVLGNLQLYQELVVKIDDQDPEVFGMNKKETKYHNKVSLTPGIHNFEITTKSIITDNGKKSMIFGIVKGEINVQQDQAYKLVYVDRIKESNVFRMELKPDDIQIDKD